jgi:hypothetical protein
MQGVQTPTDEQAFPMPASILFQFIDTGAIKARSRLKTIYVVVTVALTQTNGQATLQLYVCRAADATPAAAAATTQLSARQLLVGAAQNFGPSAATIPIGLYRFDATAIPALQWPDDHIGLEIKGFSAFGAGAMQPYLESSG